MAIDHFGYEAILCWTPVRPRVGSMASAKGAMNRHHGTLHRAMEALDQSLALAALPASHSGFLIRKEWSRIRMIWI